MVVCMRVGTLHVPMPARVWAYPRACSFRNVTLSSGQLASNPDAEALQGNRPPIDTWRDLASSPRLEATRGGREDSIGAVFPFTHGVAFWHMDGQTD